MELTLYMVSDFFIFSSFFLFSQQLTLIVIFYLTECANARAVKKKWRTPTRADIHKAIADVLCEIRCTAQMQQELDAKETQDNEDHPAEPQQM